MFFNREGTHHVQLALWFSVRLTRSVPLPLGKPEDGVVLPSNSMGFTTIWARKLSPPDSNTLISGKYRLKGHG